MSSSSGIWLDAEYVADAARKGMEYYIRRLKREYENAIEELMARRSFFFKRQLYTRKQAENEPFILGKKHFIESPQNNKNYRRVDALLSTAKTAHEEWAERLEDGTTDALIFVSSTDFRQIERFYRQEGLVMPPEVT